MNLLLLFVVLSLGVHYSQEQSTSCDEPYVDVNGICYYFSPPDTTVTWLEAREACHQIAGGLAILDTQEKNDNVALYIEENTDITSLYKWIALTDQATEGTYIWDGLGTEATYTNWYDQHGTTDYNCVTLTLFENYGWEDFECTAAYPYICQQRRKICEAPFIALAQGCYLFQAEVYYTFMAALNYCNTLNASLITIDTEYESNAISNFLSEAFPTYGFWIGAYDQGHEGDWYWESTGHPLEFTNWESGEPRTNTAQNCAWIIGDSAWITMPCDTSDGYLICEK